MFIDVSPSRDMGWVSLRTKMSWGLVFKAPRDLQLNKNVNFSHCCAQWNHWKFYFLVIHVYPLWLGVSSLFKTFGTLDICSIFFAIYRWPIMWKNVQENWQEFCLAIVWTITCQQIIMWCKDDYTIVSRWIFIWEIYKGDIMNFFFINWSWCETIFFPTTWGTKVTKSRPYCFQPILSPLPHIWVIGIRNIKTIWQGD